MMNIKENDIPRIPSGFPCEEWIPANKFLPQTNGIYLCVVQITDEIFGIQKETQCCYFNHNTQKFYWDTPHTNVTHWIPMPKLP